MRKLHLSVCRKRRDVHRQGLRVLQVAVRRSFLATDLARSTPISRLITPRGIGLQTYLVALFEAQCGHRKGNVPENDRPILTAEPGEISWLELVASTVHADPEHTVERATEQDNLARQLKAALRTLDSERLVRLGDRVKNGRFEKFMVGHESGREPFLSYRIPMGKVDGIVQIPIEFFLRGWVHVLTPAEIAIYLMILDLATTFERPHAASGVYISGSRRENAYTLRRDVYEAHRQLASFGLIQKMPDPRRWPSGQLRNYRAAIDNGEVLLAHRFKIVDRAFRRDALDVALRSLPSPCSPRARP
jgi:hypothetical protein